MKRKLFSVFLSSIMIVSSISLPVLAETSNTKNKEEISISSDKEKTHQKLAKVTNVLDDTITVVFAKRGEKKKDKKQAEQVDNSTSKQAIEISSDNKPRKPEMQFSEEEVTIDITDSVEIKVEDSDKTDISALSKDMIISLKYNDSDELIKISQRSHKQKDKAKDEAKSKASDKDFKQKKSHKLEKSDTSDSEDATNEII